MRLSAKFVFLLCLVVCRPVTYGDALVVNQAMKASTIIQYYVEENGIRAELEIGLGSVESFKRLLPDSIYQELGYGDEPIGERQRLFFEKELSLLTSDNKPLPGELLQIGPSHRVLRDPINGTPLPIQDEAPQVVRATVLYHYMDNQLPEQLVFVSPPAKGIGFVVYHKGVAINDFRYLSSGFTLTLDWQDPWYSSFNSRNLKRQYSAPMSGFIYVEPFEVRKEIIARPKDLQRWIDLGLGAKTTIPVEMQAEIKQKVATFLAEHHPVVIDNEPVEGILDSINFLERTLTSSRVVDPPVELNLDAAILGAIFVYPTKDLPQRVVMDWDLWDERIDNVPVSAVDQAGPLPTSLQPDWRELVWENFLKNPIVPTLNVVETPVAGWRILLHKSVPISAILAVAALLWLVSAGRNNLSRVLPASTTGLLLTTCLATALLGGSNDPAPERATAIVSNLLHNIYRSFDYREEADIYDMLDRSVTGELLTDIFLETKRSLVLANQGGAQAKVKEVTLQDLILKPNDDDNGFTSEVSWTVAGSVGHWGHIHQRSNRYQALLTIVVDEQQWKLQEMNVLQEERL